MIIVCSDCQNRCAAPQGQIESFVGRCTVCGNVGACRAYTLDHLVIDTRTMLLGIVMHLAQALNVNVDLKGYGNIQANVTFTPPKQTQEETKPGLQLVDAQQSPEKKKRGRPKMKKPEQKQKTKRGRKPKND